MTRHRIYTTSVASVYPHYVAKAEKKGRTKVEVDAIIGWLTSYSPEALQAQLDAGTDFETFFAEAPAMNPARAAITGTVCGVRVEEVEEPTMRSLLSALLGFLLSQSFNFVSFLRRPKFRVKHWNDGVLTSYTGDPPETPWEIELGFYLENCGRNPAKNTRVFVSDLMSAAGSNDPLELTSIELLELKRPIDLIPSRESVAVKLGIITSDKCTLALNLQAHPDEDQSGFIDAETRGKVRFSAKFYVSCDDKNSFQSFSLDFRPVDNEWASSLLEDYNEEKMTRPC